MLKIISGNLKGRIIPIIKGAKFKPSTTRTREAIFSIISSWQFTHKLVGANVLDVFCGSGSLGLEAVSRGAGFVSFIDSSLPQIALLKEFTSHLALSNVGFIHANAERLPAANRKYDIVIMDPPYFANLAVLALLSLQKGNWLADEAIIIVELATKEDLLLPATFALLDKRVYGNNKLLFLQTL
jgi:16S rRNA (guanine966-N2)-methyltransferase